MKYPEKGSIGNIVPALLIILSISIIACSERERANPFDPQSPEFGGMGGLNALAGNGKVYLYWGRLDYDDLEGFDIMRVSLASQDTTILNDTTLSPDDVDFMDSSAENGITYAYSLRLLVIGSHERPVTIPDLATPGILFGWLVSGNGSQVLLMTPDFRDELLSLDADFLQADDIQFTPKNNEIWVLDKSYDKISRFNLAGEPLEDNPIFSNTATFTFNYQDNSLWIALSGSDGNLYHFDANGVLEESFRTGLAASSLAVDYSGHGVWIGSSDNRLAWVHNGKVRLIENPEFSYPELVATGRHSANAWIMDTGAKTLFLFSGGKIDWHLTGFADPTDIAVSNDGSTCWVADPVGDILYQIDENANIIGRLENLGQPWKLTYSPMDNTVYVSSKSGMISNVGEGAVVLWQVNHPYYPGKIALEVVE